MAQDTFVHRLAPKIGKPVATLFAESGSDRRLIIEITVSAVAAYLGGKFLDGFIEGLGIKDAGKRLGERVKHAITDLADLILDEQDGQDSVLDLEHQALILQEVARELVPYLDNEPARLRGEDAVLDELIEKGLPPSEAQRLATAVSGEMLSTATLRSGDG